jgi:hypothetical protein
MEEPMPTFMILIVETDSTEDNNPVGPEIQLRIEDDGKIHEMHVTTNGGPGLTSASIPTLNFQAISDAFSGSVTSQAVTPGARHAATLNLASAGTTEAPVKVPVKRARKTATPAPVPTTQEVQTATEAWTAAQEAIATKRATPAKKEASTPAPKKTVKATPAKKTATPKADSSKKRPYRRAPNPAEIIDAFTEVGGNVTRLGEKLDVPRHTVTGWLRKLRQSDEYAEKLDAVRSNGQPDLVPVG